jgi:uncharacterized UPF0160 family protein
MSEMFYFITHDLGFHTDEVLSYSIFHFLYSDTYNIKLVRTRNISYYEQLENVIFVDIGQKYIPHKYYDHHQIDNGLIKILDIDYSNNKNKFYNFKNVKYSAAGLIWKDYGKDFIKKHLSIDDEDAINQVFKLIDNSLITHIDLVDNGNYPNIKYNFNLTNIIKKFYPSPLAKDKRSEEDYNNGFLEYAKFLEDLLFSLVEHEYKRVLDNDMLKQLYNGVSEVLIIEDELHWKNIIINDSYFDPIKFVIAKMMDDTWRVFPISIKNNFKQYKVNFPDSWKGLQGDKFKEATDIDDVIFCHNSGFIVGTKSKESAIELVDKLLK